VDANIACQPLLIIRMRVHAQARLSPGHFLPTTRQVDYTPQAGVYGLTSSHLRRRPSDQTKARPRTLQPRQRARCWRSSSLACLSSPSRIRKSGVNSPV
jgi:hypothetical protein